MNPITVLIVEDNSTFRHALREILIAQFPCMVVEEAADGREALEKVHKSLPPLVFMDIKLPGESGLEITRKIKAQYPDIVVVVLTSYDLPEYHEAAFRYGANHFIVKGSSTFEQISSLINSAFAARGINTTCH